MRLLRWLSVVALCVVACEGTPATPPADAAIDRAADVAPTRCTSDRECSAAGLVCDTAASRCVECNRASDCGGARVCLASRCITPVRCTTSRMCPGQVCSMGLGYCVDCDTDVDCSAGQVCRGNVCVAPPRTCRSSRECSAMGQVCDTTRSLCVECAGDTDCPMDRYCGPQSTCVLRACVPNAATCASDTRARLCDARGVEQREMDCPAGQSCRAGRCQVTTCSPGTSSCADARTARVCAADGASFMTLTCPAMSTCTGSMCSGWVCVPGSATCAAAAATRMVCNADGLGRRSETCPTPANATMPRCDLDGACTFNCAPGFGDCDGSVATGCEASLVGDARNCGACGVACPVGMSCMEGRCASVAPVSPTPMMQARWGAATAVLSDGRVLVTGGYVGSTAINTTELYDTTTNRWTAGPNLPSAAGVPFVARGRDGRVFVFGGYAAAAPMTDARYFDVATTTWRAVAPMPQGRRAASAATAPDGRIFVAGGNGGAGGGGALDSVVVYDPAADRWASAAALGERRGFVAASALPDGAIAVFGGVDDGGSGYRFHASTSIYDPAANRWTAGPNMPTALAATATVLASDGLVHVVGGTMMMTGLSTAHYAYDPAARTFRTLAPLPVQRAYVGLVEAPRGTLLVIGGRAGASETEVASVLAYSLATDSWR